MYYNNEYYNDNTNNRNCQCYENFNNSCHKKVEEDFCCYPSYYNDEKYEKKENQNCWHGHFKICPCKTSHKDYCDKEYNNQECENDKPKNTCGCKRTQRRCCFCNLFRNW